MQVCLCYAKLCHANASHFWVAGTGPVCFLARLCLRGGANEADAVESSDASVQRAVECFRAEARVERKFWHFFVVKNQKRNMFERFTVSTESKFGHSEGQGQHERALLARLGHVECQLLARRPKPNPEAEGKEEKVENRWRTGMKREETYDVSAFRWNLAIFASSRRPSRLSCPIETDLQICEATRCMWPWNLRKLRNLRACGSCGASPLSYSCQQVSSDGSVVAA